MNKSMIYKWLCCLFLISGLSMTSKVASGQCSALFLSSVTTGDGATDQCDPTDASSEQFTLTYATCPGGGEPDPLDISGLTIFDNTGTGNPRYVFPAGSMITSGGSVTVVAGDPGMVCPVWNNSGDCLLFGGTAPASVDNAFDVTYGGTSDPDCTGAPNTIAATDQGGGVYTLSVADALDCDACVPAPMCDAAIAAATPAVTVTSESSCTVVGGSPSGGAIAAAAACPTGSTLEYSTDAGATWSTMLPVYDQDGPAQSIMARCVCDMDNTMIGTGTAVSTVPGACPAPCVAPTVTAFATCVNDITTTDAAQDMYFVEVNIASLGGATSLDVTVGTAATQSTGATGMLVFGPFPNTAAANGILSVTAVDPADATCTTSLEVYETLCGYTTDNGIHASGPVCDCDLAPAGSILAQSDPATISTDGTQIYVLTDDMGVIIAYNYTGLFTGLDNDDYLVYATNICMSESATFEAGLTVGVDIDDYIAGYTGCFDGTCSAPFTLACDCGIFDLALTKVLNDTPDNGSSFVPGEVVTFDICVYNQGTGSVGTATNTQVTDFGSVIPGDLFFVGLVTPLPTMSQAGNPVVITDNGGGVFTIDNINSGSIDGVTPGDIVCVSVDYQISPAFTGNSIINNAEITDDSGDDTDSTAGDNSDDNSETDEDDDITTFGTDDFDPAMVMVCPANCGDATTFWDGNGAGTDQGDPCDNPDADCTDDGGGDPGGGDPSGIQICGILADPATIDGDGDGMVNSCDESITICNTGAASVDISGYEISDLASIRHLFPAGSTIAAGSCITLFSSDFNSSTCGSGVWNNGGDTATITDGAGAVVTTATYTGSSDDEEIDFCAAGINIQEEGNSK